MQEQINNFQTIQILSGKSKLDYKTKIDFIKYGFFANVSNTFLENKLDVSFSLD
jgi:hypothetical protein